MLTDAKGDTRTKVKEETAGKEGDGGEGLGTGVPTPSAKR
jgi:hypothetical protein